MFRILYTIILTLAITLAITSSYTNLASASPELHCSIAIDFQNNVTTINTAASSPENCLAKAASTGCNELCKEDENPGNCKRKCIADASFYAPKCPSMPNDDCGVNIKKLKNSLSPKKQIASHNTNGLLLHRNAKNNKPLLLPKKSGKIAHYTLRDGLLLNSDKKVKPKRVQILQPKSSDTSTLSPYYPTIPAQTYQKNKKNSAEANGYMLYDPQKRDQIPTTQTVVEI